MQRCYCSPSRCYGKIKLRNENSKSHWLTCESHGTHDHILLSDRSGSLQNYLFYMYIYFIYIYVCKGKVIKHYAMKAYGGSGCIDLRILDLGTSWRWMVSFTPRPLYPLGKSPRYPLDRRLDGPHSRSVRRGEEKILALPGLELRPLGRTACSQSLYRLRYPGSLKLG
jgi:hypothetical protein